MKRAGIYAVLVFWSLVCVFPIYWVALTSLKSEDDIIHGRGWLPFVDFTPSLRAWRFVFLDANESLLWPLFNSFVIAAASTLLAMIIGTLMLYAVTRLLPPFSRAAHSLFAVVLSTKLLPSIIVAIPLYIMAQRTRLLDTRTAMTLTYAAINLPVAAWLLRPVIGFRATEQEESAQLDGASRITMLFEVLLPMIMRGFVAVALLVFVLAWNEYLLAAFLTTNEAMTLPVWMVGQLSMKEAQIAGEAEEWANMSAAAMVMATPLFFATVWAMRAMARSMTTKN